MEIKKQAKNFSIQKFPQQCPKINARFQTFIKCYLLREFWDIFFIYYNVKVTWNIYYLSHLDCQYLQALFPIIHSLSNIQEIFIFASLYIPSLFLSRTRWIDKLCKIRYPITLRWISGSMMNLQLSNIYTISYI